MRRDQDIRRSGPRSHFGLRDSGAFEFFNPHLQMHAEHFGAFMCFDMRAQTRRTTRHRDHSPDVFLSALHIDERWRGDQDVGHRAVAQQRFERAEAEDFVEDFFDEPLALGQRHGERFVEDELFHHGADLPADAVFVQVLELIRREGTDEFLMDLAFELEPAVGSGTRSDEAATH